MDENSPEAMFNKMMEQAQEAAQQQLNNPAMPSGQPGAPPVLNTQEQAMVQQMQNQLIAGTPPPAVAPTNPVCPECGLIHPPVAAGKKCPNSIEKVKDGENKSIDVNKYLVIWRDIVIANISKQGIKNSEKLFQEVTISITKFLEGYKE
jgi:hypothetical protein